MSQPQPSQREKQYHARQQKALALSCTLGEGPAAKSGMEFSSLLTIDSLRSLVAVFQLVILSRSL